MAEGEAKALPKKGSPDNKEDVLKEDNFECAVCLQTCIHPAQLPCGHIFCFLCIKGIANQSKRCAMCRQEIPRDFIEQPNLLQPAKSLDVPESFDGGYQWFYEGRNGWWQYDARTCEELEEAYMQKLTNVEILICGELYVINFKENFQFPKRNPSKKRYIKRDIPRNLDVKGIAGWWQYDERTSRELEQSYKSGERTCELLIAGFLYVTDLEAMLQIRRNDPSRRRRIKRDLATVPKKGIAGLRTNGEETSQPSGSLPVEVQRNLCTSQNRTQTLTPLTPSNTPQTPISGRTSPNSTDDLETTISSMQSLDLSRNAFEGIEWNQEESGHDRSSNRYFTRYRNSE